MKKIIALIGLFALVLVAMPCNTAHASSEVTAEMIEGAIEVNYGYDNIVIFKNASGKYMTLVETDTSKNYGAPYNADDYSNKWRIKSESGKSVLVSPSYWWCIFYEYDFTTATWKQTVYKNFYTEIEGLEFVYASQDIIYAQHDVYEDDTVFFKAPLHLARIVEQSTRRATPMSQVIFLLPLAISLVASFLALRKCLQVLRTILSGA